MSMFRYVRWLVAVLAFSSAAGLQAAARDGVDVQLSAPNPVLNGDVDVVVNVTVTNTTRHPITLLQWQLPSDDLEGPLFKVTRDDQPVRYLGPVIKRATPDASDHVKLEAGATL